MKSFLEYIAEGKLYSFTEDLADTIILDLKSFPKSTNYSLIKEYEFLEPVKFDLKVIAKWDQNPDFKSDFHFSELEWERHNFVRLGYSINAITKFNDQEYRIPEIDLFILIDSENDQIYEKLRSRLVGIIGHELRHVRQIGLNREPFMGRVSSQSERSNSQNDYKYFLLPEELDAMVEDKYIQAIEENKPIDEVMCQYLYPFVKDGFMSSLEFKKVYTIWVKRAIELFPDAIFSKKAEKIIEKI
jgi:hypothetical protein